MALCDIILAQMNNPLKDIFSSISNFMSSEESIALGIDIGSSSIKVVEIKKKGGRAILETYGSIALGPYDSQDAGKVTNLPIDKVSSALKEVLKQSGVTTSSGAFSIPVQSSLIFIIDLPTKVSDSEMQAVVSTEARRFIPVPITEVSLDYFVLPQKEASFEEMNKVPSVSDVPKSNGEKTGVLVVATQNDAISKYRSLISECSLSASFFEIEIFSSVRSNFEHELSPVLLIDFGASRTKLSIFEYSFFSSGKDEERFWSFWKSIRKKFGRYYKASH